MDKTSRYFFKCFISFFKKENNEKEELNKEILFFRNLFSISKEKQEKYLDDIISIFEIKELFQYLKKQFETIKKMKFLFFFIV